MLNYRGEEFYSTLTQRVGCLLSGQVFVFVAWLMDYSVFVSKLPASNSGLANVECATHLAKSFCVLQHCFVEHSWQPSLQAGQGASMALG